MIKLVKSLSYVLLWCSLSACFATNDTQTQQTNQMQQKEFAKSPVSEPKAMLISLHSSNVCGSIQGSQWLPDQAAYTEAFERMNKMAVKMPRPQPKPVDFNQYNVILVAMGQQRTGGFSVKLRSDQLKVSEGVATIGVQWITPKKGMMLIQMLTNPCLFVQVPKGDYQRIQIVDQRNTVRATLTAP